MQEVCQSPAMYQTRSQGNCGGMLMSGECEHESQCALRAEIRFLSQKP
jgi:hypothetical protein